MKTEKPPPRIEDVELLPDAMERLEGAVKHAARKPIAGHTKGARRVDPAKPKRRRRASTHP